jgi:predicted nucleic acid-binding protein
LVLIAAYLADTSALARLSLPPVAARVVPLLEEGLVATCAIIDLEVFYSARSDADYEEVLEERRALNGAPVTPEVMGTAINSSGR